MTQRTSRRKVAVALAAEPDPAIRLIRIGFQVQSCHLWRPILTQKAEHGTIMINRFIMMRSGFGKHDT
jgi:hypothetical protein